MAELYFKVGADWENVKRLREEISKLEAQLKGLDHHAPASKVKAIETQLASTRKEMNRLTKEAANAGSAFDSLKKFGAAAFGVAGLKEFASQVVRIRGEFQEMETSIETLVGKSMKDKLTPQIKELAKTSPLTMTDIVGAEKMMLGFNIEADKTIGYLKALSDVSMGNSQKFNSLTLAFSQMSATGKLMGQDLNQMINAGFNPLQQIAKTTGKSIAQLKEEMSKGAVTAEMVQQALIDATSAGGKFYKMSENASKTINGQISMMEDAMDAAFNEMGQASEGFIMKSIEMTTTLIENYETVGKVIGVVAATYGTYKAALAAILVYEKLQVVSRAAAIAHTNMLAVATGQLTKKIAALNLVTKANPWVLLASVVIGAATAMWSMADTTSAAERAAESLAEKKQKLADAEERHKQEVNNLLTVLESEVASEEDRSEALVKLESKYPDIFKKYDTEYEKLKNLKKIKEEIARLDEERVQGRNTNIINNNNAEIEGIERALRKKNRTATREDYKSKPTQAEKIMDVSYDSMTVEELKFKLQLLKDENKAAQKELNEELRVSNMTSEKLAGLTLEQIQAAINMRKKALEVVKLRDAQGKTTKEVNIKGGYNAGEKTTEQVQAEMQQLEAELNKRNADRKTASDWQADARKRYNEAQKAYDNFLSSNEKLSAEEYEKKKQALKKALDDAKKSLDNEGGKTSGSNKSKKEIESSALETRQLLLDLEDETTTKRIEQIHLNYDKEIAEIKKKEKELKEARGGQLTQEDNDLVAAMTLAAEANKAKALDDIRKEEIQSMRDYLKEYGTLEQQRLAIAEEYAEKIAKAQTEGERKTLEQQKNADLANLNVKAINQSIDWASVFGDLGGIMRRELQENLEAIEKYMQGSEFKNLLPSDKQAIVNARDELKGRLGGDLSDINIKKIGELTTEFQKAQQVWLDAKNIEKESQNRLTEAQTKYNSALKTGDKATIESAKKELDAAETQYNVSQDWAKKTTEVMTKTGNDLGDATKNAVDAIDGVSQAVSDIKSGSLGQAYNGIKKLASHLSTVTTGGVKKVLESISSAMGGGIGEIIGAALGLIDLLKDGIGTIIADLNTMVWNAVNGILEDVLSGGIITKSIDANLRGMGNVLDTLTFGGFNDWMFGNDDAYKEALDKWSWLLDSWEDNIEYERELMEESYGVDVLKTQAEAEAMVKETQQAAKEIYQGWASSGAGWFSHSKGYEANEDAGWKYLEQYDAALAKKIGRNITNLFDLSAEELKKLKYENAQFWNTLPDTAKEYLDMVIEAGEELKTIQEQAKEQLTGINFENAWDGLIDSLMDASKTVEDIIDDIAENIQRNLLENTLGNTLKKELEEWSNLYYKYMEDGVLSDEEFIELQNMYKGIVEEGKAEAERLSQITGYGDTFQDAESAAARGIQNITSEQANALEGRITAMQIAQEQGNVNLSMLTIKMDDIVRLSAQTENTLGGISDILADSYLELQGINNNTKHLKVMSEDLAEIKKLVKENS